jgi:hypothetical protein
LDCVGGDFDGKVGTYNSAEATTDAARLVEYLGVEIPFYVDICGHLDDFLRARPQAQFASFAAIFID